MSDTVTTSKESARPRANPFRPGFGHRLDVVAGRKEILAVTKESFANPDWGLFPNIALIAWPGTGKTVMLCEMGDLAREAGWLVIDDSVSFKEPFADRVGAWIEESWPASAGPINQLGDQPCRLGRAVETVMGQPDAPAGILITVDEIHAASPDDLKVFEAPVQRLQGNGFPICVVVAGIPARLEAGAFGSYEHFDVSILTDSEIELGLIQTAAVAGFSFTDHALAMAVEASGGYAYMMQLVGWHACEETSKRDSQLITDTNIVGSVVGARRQLWGSSLRSVSDMLSEPEEWLLAAMAIDVGPSEVEVLGYRLNRSETQVTQCCENLISEGLICRVGDGVVDFVIAGHRAGVRGDGQYQALQARSAKRRKAMGQGRRR